MRRLILTLLPLACLMASCSTTDYDLVSTAAVPPRFHDNDPQDFGARTPHHHHIHGIGIAVHHHQRSEDIPLVEHEALAIAAQITVPLQAAVRKATERMVLKAEFIDETSCWTRPNGRADR